MRTFAAVARHGSFTAAAASLCVTQGAVSRMIQTLEADLGVTLFHRHGRSITLTAAGEAYAHQINGALDQIAAASRAVRRQGQGGLLRVSVLPTFALRWLVPRLHRFQQAYPDILVDVTSSEHTVDFRSETVDVAVRYGVGPWPTATAEPLMPEEVGLFCAPSLCPPLPMRPGGLTDALTEGLTRRLLFHSTRPESWPEFCAAFDLPPPDLTQAPAFEHFFMIIEAAAAGMGMALLPLFLARAEVASGRLVQAAPQTLRRRQGYALLYAPGTGASHKIRAFCDWLHGEVREELGGRG